MKNFMTIRKLYETYDQPQNDQEMQSHMQTQQPSKILSMDQFIDNTDEIDNTDPMADPMADQMAEPMTEPMAEPMDNQQTALPAFDPMNLTVSQFIERCDKINPLVCMGLSAFIEANSEALANEVNGGEEFDLDKEANLDFPPVAAPETKANDFSLDQPEADLDFPQEAEPTAI
jgi:hypothetical protein